MIDWRIEGKGFRFDCLGILDDLKVNRKFIEGIRPGLG